jgi:integrase
VHHRCPCSQDYRSRHRKTCASLLAALDVHPRIAMRIMRHSKIAVTMEIYTEAPSDATRDALRKLSDWLA